IFIVSSGFRDIAQLGKSQKDAHTYTSGREVYEIADRNELFNHSPASPFAGKTCPADKELITNVSTVLLFGIGGDAQNSVLPRYLAPDEIANLTAFSEYNSQRIQNLQ